MLKYDTHLPIVLRHVTQTKYHRNPVDSLTFLNSFV